MSKENYPGSEEARIPIMEDGNLRVTNRPGLVRRQLFADPQEFTGRDAITAGVSQVTIDAAKHLDVDEPKKVKRTPPIRSQGESLSARPGKILKPLNPLLVHELISENIHPDRPQIDTMQIYRDIKAARRRSIQDGIYDLSTATKRASMAKPNLSTVLDLTSAEELAYSYHPCINWTDFKDNLTTQNRRALMTLVRMGNRHPTHKADYIGKTKRGLVFMILKPDWGLK